MKAWVLLVLGLMVVLVPSANIMAMWSSTPGGMAFRSDRTIVRNVQGFLRSQEKVPSVSVDGIWSTATRESLQAYLKHLQSESLFGLAWKGPEQGIYTAQYSRYLKRALTAARAQDIDPNYTIHLTRFVDDMDQLTRDNVYHADNLEMTLPSGPRQDHVNGGSSSFMPLALELANGALSGFGDELYCASFEWPDFAQCHEKSKSILEHFEQEHSMLATSTNFIGAAVNVISSVLSLIAIETDCTGALVLGLSFAMGLLDFLLYAVGDAWTADQVLSFSSVAAQIRENWGPLLVMGILSGFVMMWVVAIHRWKHKVPPIGAVSSFDRFWG